MSDGDSPKLQISPPRGLFPSIIIIIIIIVIIIIIIIFCIR